MRHAAIAAVVHGDLRTDREGLVEIVRELGTRDDPIGAKIMERLGEDVATGALADDPEPQPQTAKPHKRKTAAKSE